MAIFMFSLAGIPPTAGFFGKYYVFRAAIDGGFYWLTVIAFLNSVIGAYYYLRVMVYMYMKDSTEEFDWMQVTVPMALCVAISVAGSLVPGIIPSVILQFAQQAIKLI